MLRFILFVLVPLVLASAWLVHEVRLYRREVSWQQRRKLADALRIAFHYKADQRDREAAEREAFDRKLKEEEDGDA
jgi:predicted Holliday junction resolvase-like endonuclease